MRLLRSDATKLILYLVCCFLLAALTTPWLYNAGMLSLIHISEPTRPY